VSFRRVADAASLWPGEMKGILVDATRVLLLNVGGDVRAYEDSCPHRGVALSCGTLEASGTLTCAMHLWQYDARTGKGLNPRCARAGAGSPAPSSNGIGAGPSGCRWTSKR